MLLDPLGDWAVDPQTGRFELLRAISDAPEAWLRWASAYLDPDLWRRQWPAPGVPALSGTPSISGALRCSGLWLYKLTKCGKIEVNSEEYRSRTSLAEVWRCANSLKRRCPK